MNAHLALEKAPPFIHSQLQPEGQIRRSGSAGLSRFTVTLSRQTGSGAHAIGELLLEYFRAATPADLYPWQLFDRNLVERVLEDHHLPRRFARFMPEDPVSGVTDAMDELLGAHPPYWKLVRQTTDTILRLAKQGNVILIGRGANVITRHLEHAFHVRLVGSIEMRIRHIQELQGVSKRAASEFIQAEDRGRRRYLRKHFGKDPDDPLLYHLVINTDLVPYERAARMIGESVLQYRHCPQLDPRAVEPRTRQSE